MKFSTAATLLQAAIIGASFSSSQARIAEGERKLDEFGAAAGSMSVPSPVEMVQLSSFDESGGKEKPEKEGKDKEDESLQDAVGVAAAFATTTTTTVKPSSKASKPTVMSAKGSKQPTSMMSAKAGKIGLPEIKNYFYTKTLSYGESDVIFDEGPLKVTARCEEDDGEVSMLLTLFNPTEDMLVYGNIEDDSNGDDGGLQDPPIGATKYQVLDKGDTYEKVMWDVSNSGSDIDNGAVKLLTLTTHQSYYMGYYGETFIGLHNDQDNLGLEGGGDCALSGVFSVVFPERNQSSKAGK